MRRKTRKGKLNKELKLQVSVKPIRLAEIDVSHRSGELKHNKSEMRLLRFFCVCGPYDVYMACYMSYADVQYRNSD